MIVNIKNKQQATKEKNKQTKNKQTNKKQNKQKTKQKQKKFDNFNWTFCNSLIIIEEKQFDDFN